MTAIKNTAGGATAPTGSAGGDLAGSYPNPTVAQVSGLNLFLQAANQIAQYNGTNGQGSYVYNTRTDASNYERLALFWSANTLNLVTQQAGTGLGRNLLIGTSGGQWAFDSAGAFRPAADGTLDIGLTTRRIRHLYQSGVQANAGSVVSIPTTGQTVTVAQTTNCAIADPAGALAALTVQFPTPLIDGHAFQLVLTAAITALTLTPNSGASIKGGITSTSGYSVTRWRYVAASTTWYQA